MNKILTSIAAVVLLIFSSVGKADIPITDALANVVDDNLRACLAEATSEMNNTQELSRAVCNGLKIKSIYGIEQFTGLTFLILSSNQISDISPLSGLIELRRLLLPMNQITDITPLNKLTNLKILNLIRNQISDISTLSNLPQLKSVMLHFNKICDFSSMDSLIYLPSGATHVIGSNLLSTQKTTCNLDSDGEKHETE